MRVSVNYGTHTAMTDETTNTPRDLVPPYLSVSRLDRVLDLAKTRTLNQVSTALFSTYGFNNTDAALAVKALKFLGAVDDNGNATDVMANLRLESEDRRKQAFATIVRDSYARLFKAVKDPYALPKAELADEFKVQYQQSSRVVESALPVFLRLSEYAGLIEPGTIARRSPQKPRADKPKPEKKVPATGIKVNRLGNGRAVITQDVPEGMHVQQVMKDKMTVVIPEDAFIRAGIDDDMNDAWRAVLKAAHAFATKYLQEEEKPKPDTESGDGGS